MVPLRIYSLTHSLTRKQVHVHVRYLISWWVLATSGSTENNFHFWHSDRQSRQIW